MNAMLLNEVGGDPRRDNIGRVFGKGRLERLAELTELFPLVISPDMFHEYAKPLAEVEVVFSTWGMPRLTPDQLAMMPRLRAVFYAAGSVKGFAGPLLEAGITVVSAWAANAVPVAEFSLAQILLSCKRYWHNVSAYSAERSKTQISELIGPGVYGETVALIGFGMIGQRVAELLRPFRLRRLAVDPHVPQEVFVSLDVERVELHEAFAQAIVVSNHLPNLTSLCGVLKAEHFRAMRNGATFINTGRGAQVCEDDLCTVLGERTDLTALLDVTFPEPPTDDSPLWKLPNAHLTSHIAGSINDEVLRMADLAIDEFETWRDGRSPRYAVSADMLATMA